MQVKVRNLNTHPYSEKFKGDMITIPPGGALEMEEYEAQDFLRQFKPPLRDGDNNHLAQGFKMLKIEYDADTKPVEAVATVATTFSCNACKEVFQTMASLNLHSEHAHKAEAFTDELAEAEMKRKPGRPAKQAS